MDYNFEKKSEGVLKKIYNFSAKAILLNIVSWWIVIAFGFSSLQSFAMQYSQNISLLTVFIAVAISYAMSMIVNYLLYKLLDKYGHSW